MPIRRDLQKFYDHTWRTVTRPRILARAGNRCEKCGKPNHARIATTSGKEFGSYWMIWCEIDKEGLTAGVWRDEANKPAHTEYDRDNPYYRRIRVVLTIAHINHVAGDDRDENLAAWCQWCHLTHDHTHHRRSRETRKDEARPLLMLAPEEQ